MAHIFRSKKNHGGTSTFRVGPRNLSENARNVLAEKDEQAQWKAEFDDYIDAAQRLGIPTRFEVVPVDRVDPRGVLETEAPEESRKRFDQIVSHIDEMNPIFVLPKPDGRLDTSNGNHRLAVYRQLNRPTVGVVILDTQDPVKIKAWEDFVQEQHKIRRVHSLNY